MDHSRILFGFGLTPPSEVAAGGMDRGIGSEGDENG